MTSKIVKRSAPLLLSACACVAACDSATKPRSDNNRHVALTLVSTQAADTVHGRVVGFRGTVDTVATVSFSVGGGAEQPTQQYPVSPTTGTATFQGEAHPLSDGTTWIVVRVRISGALAATDSFPVVVDVPQRHYAATVVDSAGSLDVQGLYLANDGRLAGNWWTNADTVRAFTWKDGTFTSLDSMRQVTGLNNVGQVLGWSGTAALSSQTIVWSNGAYQTIADFTGGKGINDQGWVVRSGTVGYWESGQVVSYTVPPNTGYIVVGSINNAGVIGGGRVYATRYPTPVIWTSPSTWITPPDAFAAWLPQYSPGTVTRIGDGGHVLLSTDFINLLGAIPDFLVSRSLLYFSGQTQDLSSMVGFTTVAASVNLTGVVAGTYLDAGGVRAFTWASGRTTDVVLDTPGWSIDNVYAINDQGVLSVRAHNAANHHAALILTPTP